MGFPKETETKLLNGDYILHVVPPADIPKLIKVTELLPDRFNEAIHFLATQYKFREPLLRTLHRVFKKEPDLDQLKEFFERRFDSHIGTSFIAVDITPGVPSKEASVSGNPIVGVCFNRVLSFTDYATSGSKCSSSERCIEYWENCVPTTVDLSDLLVSTSKTNTSKETILETRGTSPTLLSERIQIFDIGAVAVDYSLCARRIARSLVWKSMSSAISNACTIMRCDTTSYYFAKLLESVGFKLIVDLPYPHASIGDSTCAVETPYPHFCLRVLIKNVQV